MIERSWFSRMFRWLEPLAPPSSDEWLRRVGTWPLLMAGTILTPLALSGIVRTFTGLPFVLSLVIAAVGVAIAVIAARRVLFERSRWRVEPWFFAVAGGVYGFDVYCLYVRAFGGFQNYRGTDASFHSYHLSRFLTDAPAIYNRCVEFYAFAASLEKIFSINRFWSFCATFYVVVAALVLIPLSISSAIATTLNPARRRIAAAAVGVFTVIVHGVVTLPVLHVFEKDGFLPQVFALVPLFAIWIADVLVRVRSLRLLCIALGLLLYRYAYGLNVADALLASALIVILDSPVAPRPAKLAYYLGTALLLAAAAWSYIIVGRRWTDDGHIVAYHVPLVIVGELAAIAGLMIFIGLSRRALRGGGIYRAVRWPMLFGLANAAMSFVGWMANAKYFYFTMKYPFHAIMLVPTAVAAVVPVACVALVHSGATSRASLVGIMTATAIALTCWWRGLESYRPHFLENLRGTPPFEYSIPVADLGGWRRIERVLQSRGKQFGGYLSSNFGMMMFMNASLGHPAFDWSVWFKRAFQEQPGRCVFWDEGSSRDWPVWEAWFPQRRLRTELLVSTNKTCESYVAHWNPKGAVRRLCYRCE